ncbi:MAG: alpha-amylase family glycosyl hydrolase [Bacteroidota bacterium]
MRTLSALLFSLLITASLMSASTVHKLDGEWAFQPDSARSGLAGLWYSASFDRSAWSAVSVPAFWETYPGLENYNGWGWFARTFTVDSTEDRLSVYFEGVDDDAVVWVNGVKVGEHSGFSDPFVVDVSTAVREGENSIVVLVKDYEGGGGIYKSVTLSDSRNLDDVLKSPYFGKHARESAAWVKDAVIYSVYLRSFSREGTFAGLQKRLPELKNMGITVLWLLPINPVGVKNRKGTLGSPYAVRDYYGINPEFGTMADFKRLLAAAHRQGLKLIIDLVANHTSWDSKLMEQHPDWFTRDSTGAIVSPNPDWTDVADLDYSKTGLRQYMEKMMVWWVKDVGIDGFRCDVAELVPTDFWEEARARLDAVKPVMMLSEGSLPQHHMKAFDITYSWNVYDQLEPILSARKPATTIDILLKNESLQFPIGALRMRFTTNHDKNAWDAPAVTKFGPAGLKAATVLINTMPGIPLMYTGEEVANDRRLSLFEKVDVDWSRPRTMGTLNAALFHCRAAHNALREGSMVKLPTSDDQQVYAFLRVAGTDSAVVLINLHKTAVNFTLDVPEEYRAGISRLCDLFTGKPLPQKDARVHLEGYGYGVYVVR